MASKVFMHQPLLHAISAASLPKMSAFDAQCLASTAWSMSKLRYVDLPLRASISAAAINLIDDFGAVEISNSAWAFAMQALRDIPLMAALSSAAIQQLSDFGPQELTSTAWAFATLWNGDKPLMHAIAPSSMQRISQFATRSFAGTAWAFAVLKFSDLPLLTAIASAAIPTITFGGTCKLDPQALATTAWAFAELAVLHQPLFEAISAASRLKLSEFSSQEIAMLSWSLSRLPDLRHVKDFLMESQSCNLDCDTWLQAIFPVLSRYEDWRELGGSSLEISLLLDAGQAFSGSQKAAFEEAVRNIVAQRMCEAGDALGALPVTIDYEC